MWRRRSAWSTSDLVRREIELGEFESWEKGDSKVEPLHRIRKILANTKGTLIIQHDARDVGKLPAFPAGAR